MTPPHAPSLFLYGIRPEAREHRGKAALKKHALQTLARGPLTSPRAPSSWSASDSLSRSVMNAIMLRQECLQRWFLFVFLAFFVV